MRLPKVVVHTNCNPMLGVASDAAPLSDRTTASSCSNVLARVSVLLRFCLPAELILNWPAVFVCSLRLAPRLRC